MEILILIIKTCLNVMNAVAIVFDPVSIVPLRYLQPVNSWRAPTRQYMVAALTPPLILEAFK